MQIDACTSHRIPKPSHSPGRLALGMLALLLLLAWPALPLRAQGVATYPNPGPGSVVLDGPWAFRLGDDSRWAKPDLDDHDWEQLQPTSGWGAQGHPAQSGFGW